MGSLAQSIISFLPRAVSESYRNLFPRASTLSFSSLAMSVPWVAVGLVIVHFNTIIHPYTLADNRHYVFYVFKIFRLYPAVRYVAVPLYPICAWLAMQALSIPSNEDEQREECPSGLHKTRPPCKTSFIIIWLATTTLSVVSAPLVEPRYFIIPWIIWRLHARTFPASLSSNRETVLNKYDVRLIIETIWLLVVNAAVTYVFIRRPFEWLSEPGKIQRFLW